MINFYTALKQAIASTSIDEKISLTNQLYDNYKQPPITSVSPNKDLQAGLPDKIKLVSPKELPKRKLNSIEGKACLLHAIAHIEFNAINLALDAIYRFKNLPDDFYRDWLKVAYEECYHFSMLNSYLNDLGYEYGSFVAHNGLWQMAEKTSHDILLRMALVPKLLEARGLDATPGIMQKLKNVNDTRGINILTIIENDEIGHVAIGNKWFNYLCQQQNLNPFETFKKYIEQYARSFIKKPLSKEKRLIAGFTVQELEFLEATAI